MTHPFDLLQSHLLDLLYRLRESDINLIVGGGYGLYLKRQHLQTTGLRPLLPLIPEARSTDDLDLFLRTQILIDTQKAKSVLQAVLSLQFQAVKDRENFQFVKTYTVDGQAYQVKLDFLTRMPDDQEALAELDIQDVRIRNKRSGGIHAHKTEEAVSVEDDPMPITLTGRRTSGEEFSGQIYLPQSYAYLMMKLFAFRDWETKKQDAGYARKHALDLYSIVAMLTEEEFKATELTSTTHRQKPAAQEAAEIVHDFFSQTTALGVLRLREHQGFSQEMDVTEFISVLGEFFPSVISRDGAAVIQ